MPDLSPSAMLFVGGLLVCTVAIVTNSIPAAMFGTVLLGISVYLDHKVGK